MRASRHCHKAQILCAKSCVVQGDNVCLMLQGLGAKRFVIQIANI